MKTANLGDYLLWDGDLAKVVGTSNSPQVIIELIEKKCECPNCGHDLGKKQIHVIVSSSNFQNGAEPIKTIDSK